MTMYKSSDQHLNSTITTSLPGLQDRGNMDEQKTWKQQNTVEKQWQVLTVLQYDMFHNIESPILVLVQVNL